MVKKAYSIDEQIDLLSKRGMEFDNIPKAKEILADIGYYRFGFFSFPFEKSYPNKINRTHEVVPGTTFKQVHDLYVFDSQLRFILTKALTRIEVNIRTRITYKGSMYYINDPWWFCNSSYIKAGYLNKFDREVYDAVRKNPAIQEHHKKHNRDKYAPAWKTMEFMTLGNIAFLYEAIKDQNLKKEAKTNDNLEIFKQTKTWLDKYFNKEKPNIDDLKLKLEGTPFQIKVWNVLKKVHYGQTVTYGFVAQKINSKTSARAVGGAIGHNPIPIIIPCHRVVGTNNNLTGFTGGIDVKIKLLKLEGINTTKYKIPKGEKNAKM